MKKYKLGENGYCHRVEGDFYTYMTPCRDIAGNFYWGEPFGQARIISSNHAGEGISITFDESWSDKVPSVSEAFAMFEAFKKRAST